jgi:spore coat polysaccharide biosynthesis protein SpsF
MSVTCVIQARMGSSRLPGKVLMELSGRPMLAFMLERLSLLPELRLVVATSGESRDDAVAECAAAARVAVVRGDEHDVLDRYRLAIERYPSDHVVRLTADCPLIDPGIVRYAIADHYRTGADYTSNTLIRTYPDGLDVEVISRAALVAACDEADDPAEREHVTPFVYRHNRRFLLRAVRSAARVGHLRWTVDTEADLDAVRAMVGTGLPGGYPWHALLNALAVEQRRPLRFGLQPAVEGEVPGWVTEFNDPGHQPLVAVADGRPVGALVADVEDGIVTVRGEVAPQHVQTVRAQFEQFVGVTPQITGGDIGLSCLEPMAVVS